ncbi:MAG: tetratricopeptide repeat protein [Candidatus Latescibacteria bacterium]|nr:tetratricopeptide repeat protein [Candidatus Latescibacterota bacterium]
MSDDRTFSIGPDDDCTLPLGSAGGGAAGEDVGTVIGPYRLLRRIGEGGMGEVFEAEQTEPIRRRVALKVIKQGMDTRAVVARFDAERQALAMMDHPCIAKVFDAGATDRGRPYFVMEYVEGESITDYCNRRRLGTEERLELFVRVCEGVQHAHQKAVIHRDLKPSNILVAEVDGRPVPKIIDFGVAKATTQRLTEMTMFTELGQMVGTPEYMSPEQASMTDDDIDTRTDVYALGVVLYELLSGALPFDSRDLRKAGYEAIRKIIREQDPPRPSTRFSDLGEQSTSVAEARGIAPKRLQGELRGDLDWITMKALEKDRDRRYETANGLAADVRRHLRNEPVSAGPPSASYRLGKLVRRNRGTFAALGAITFVLIAAVVVSSVMYVRAERASRLAISEAAKATQVSRFLGDMLGGVGPHVAQGRDTEMLRAILDETAARVGKELANQPEVEAALRLQLGRTYRQLGEYEAAQAQIDRVLELRSAFGRASAFPAMYLVEAGSLAWNRGEMKEAEATYRQALQRMTDTAAIDSIAFAEASLYLANVLQEQGNYGAADSLMQRSLAVYRSLPQESDALAVTLNSLGNLARYKGDLPAAEGFYTEALAVHRRVLGDLHPFVATDLHNLGRLLDAMGRSGEGEKLLREAIAIHGRVFDGPHPDTAVLLRSLAEMIMGSERFDEADSLSLAAHEMTRTIYGDRNENTLKSEISVAELKSRRGNFAEAEAIFAGLVPTCRDTGITDPSLLPTVLYRLATTQLKQGRSRDALTPFAEAVELSTATSGADHPNTLLFRNDYARALAGLGDDEAAVKQLRVVLATRERVLGAGHPETSITRVDLGRSLRRLGQPEEAEPQLRRGRDDYTAAKGIDHPGRWIGTVHLAGALIDLKRYDEAEKELTDTEAFYLGQSGAGSTDTRWVRARLSSLHLRAGHRADADRLLALALDETPGPLDARTRGRILYDRGESWLAMGELDEAEKTLLDSFKVLDAELGAANGDTQYVMRLLATTCDRLGRPRDAAAWRARLL